MTDEEKKAIDYLQLCYDLSTITNESLSKLGIILNLIEKQSKEIEELKNSDLTTVYLNGFYDGENKVKDKIKAKIEEIRKSKENIYFEEHLESILQSLLEKE